MSVPGRSVAEYALNRAGGPGCTRPLGEAINYALGQWDALALFLTDPHLPIDNYASERALRVAELGRKNFRFVGTNKAGENLAGLCSLIAPCESNDVNTVEYLAEVLIRVQTHPASRSTSCSRTTGRRSNPSRRAELGPRRRPPRHHERTSASFAASRALGQVGS